MFRDYLPLPFTLLPKGATYAQPQRPPLKSAQMESAAKEVMTDFAQVAAATIQGGDIIDEAHQRMLQYGVRLLLVVDQDRKVVGVITADDILGGVPVQIGALQGIHRDEVLVRHVMTPCRRLQVLSMAQVRSATVGHIVATMTQAGRQHTLVIDRDDTGAVQLRGIFSTSRISRQLGIPIHTSLRAGTFVELEEILMH